MIIYACLAYHDVFTLLPCIMVLHVVVTHFVLARDGISEVVVDDDEKDLVVKVVDFGCARSLASESGVEDSWRRLRMGGGFQVH